MFNNVKPEQTRSLIRSRVVMNTLGGSETETRVWKVITLTNPQGKEYLIAFNGRTKP